MSGIGPLPWMRWVPPEMLDYLLAWQDKVGGFLVIKRGQKPPPYFPGTDEKIATAQKMM